MKIFTKSTLNIKQIKLRKDWHVDGIETYLKYDEIFNPKLKDKLNWCSDNFETINLETGDRLYGRTPVDLLDDRSRKYIEKALEIYNKIPNRGILVVHLAGNCQVHEPPYKKLILEKKEENLAVCLEYINKIDPENRLIALENTFPTDWMDEDKGIISFYPFGKISADFENRIRTFDIAHSGITMYTYSKLANSSNKNYSYFESEFGRTPVYFSEEEEKITELAKKSLTNAVCEEIKRANVVNVHVNTSYKLLDGFGINEETDLDLSKILEVLKGKNITLIAEVKERQTNDYLTAQNQRGMIKFLREYFQ